MTARPSQDALFDLPPSVEPEAPPEPEPEKKAPARNRVVSDRLVATYAKARGDKYKFAPSIDGPALARLLKACDNDDEIDARWRAGLLHADKFKRVSTLAQLDSKWNDIGRQLAAPPAPVVAGKEPPEVSVLPECDACGVSGKTWTRVYRLWLCSPCLKAADDVAAKAAVAPVGVPLGDARIAQFQMAQDVAVSQWARSKRGEAR